MKIDKGKTQKKNTAEGMSRTYHGLSPGSCPPGACNFYPDAPVAWIFCMQIDILVQRARLWLTPERGYGPKPSNDIEKSEFRTQEPGESLCGFATTCP